MRGRFITLEGGEGAGKSTQIRLLAAALESMGKPVIVTREPGGSPGAEAIRALLVTGDTDRWDARTEALLHSAARRDHLVKKVWPALESGQWVLCDRFADSTIAYQGYGHGLPIDELEQLTALTVGDFAPDLTLILDLPVEAGLARAGGRGGAEDRYERMGLDFHRRLRQGFLDIAARHAERCAIIDAGQGPEWVHQAIMAVVSQRLAP
ncbi:dTMP kinase [Magnetospirillum moscoviense]|uniref:Thymidylate kinase n=1 Tax=Magnetospirillum moscoviense TaxID=1437059 RepID=A0A178MD38_9PROT|nr:dTMP kinase [Magnetospirillum moscoviense]MBF0323728.1 dTMP kinase [Alphaproteobacteria bacterium]OAN46436.1 thymidylate kinase [Magnetospirillum moscoviense]